MWGLRMVAGPLNISCLLLGSMRRVDQVHVFNVRLRNLKPCDMEISVAQSSPPTRPSSFIGR